MKRILLFFAVSAASLCFCSCGGKKSVSEKEFISVVRDYMAEKAMDVMTVDLKIGYFQCDNANERNFYKQLEELGILTCEIENYQWYTKVTKKRNVTHITDYYYKGKGDFAYSKKSNIYEPAPAIEGYDNHYFVNVKLTKKGEKLVYVAPEPKIDADLIQPEYDADKYPVDSKQFDVTFAEMPRPVLPEIPHKIDSVVDKRKPVVEKPIVEKPVVEKPVRKTESTPAVKYPIYEYIENSSRDAYLAACANENSEVVELVVCQVSVKKARDIRVVEENGVRKASAGVILLTDNVTDAGHLIVLYKYNQFVLDGQPTLKEFCLINNWDDGYAGRPEWRVGEE